MSRGERLALGGALLLLLLQAAAGLLPWLAPAMEYRLAQLGTQPWRLVSGHWVHINWPHVLINAAAWFVVARLFARELQPRHQIAAIAVACIVIGGGLAAMYPHVAWYRGFSGVLHALFFTGATCWLVTTRGWRRLRDVATWWLPLLLVLGGWIKVLLEQPDGLVLPDAAWLGAAVVPQAHLLGAACGTVLGVLLAWRRGASEPALARE